MLVVIDALFYLMASTSAAPLISGATPRPLAGDRQAPFAAYITDMLAMTNVPGAAVAVVQNGEVVYQQGLACASWAVGPGHARDADDDRSDYQVDDGDDGRDRRRRGEVTWETPVVDLLPASPSPTPSLPGG